MVAQKPLLQTIAVKDVVARKAVDKMRLANRIETDGTSKNQHR